nr:succinate dehydrogenase subunit 4 [Hypnea sp.]
MYTIEWLILRFSVLFVLIGIIFDIEITFFFISFLFVHITMGVFAILCDYIHIKKLKYISIFLMKISAIEVSKNIIELFL